MNYVIVSAPTLEDLTAVVNERWVEGYRPHGTPFTVTRGQWVEPKDSKEKRRIAQALVKGEAGE